MKPPIQTEVDDVKYTQSDVELLSAFQRWCRGTFARTPAPIRFEVRLIEPDDMETVCFTIDKEEISTLSSGDNVAEYIFRECKIDSDKLGGIRRYVVYLCRKGWEDGRKFNGHFILKFGWPNCLPKSDREHLFRLLGPVVGSVLAREEKKKQLEKSPRAELAAQRDQLAKLRHSCEMQEKALDKGERIIEAIEIEDRLALFCRRIFAKPPAPLRLEVSSISESKEGNVDLPYFELDAKDFEELGSGDKIAGYIIHECLEYVERMAMPIQFQARFYRSARYQRSTVHTFTIRPREK